MAFAILDVILEISSYILVLYDIDTSLLSLVAERRSLFVQTIVLSTSPLVASNRDVHSYLAKLSRARTYISYTINAPFFFLSIRHVSTPLNR